MEIVDLSPTSLCTTRLGFGCANLTRLASRRGRLALLESAFEQGIRHFDVARIYGLGTAERDLGVFARGRRDQLIVTTKFGMQPSRLSGRFARLQSPARKLIARYPALRERVKGRYEAVHRRHYDVAGARASLQASLRELRTDYVDILFVHDPAPEDAIDLPELCAFLEDARRAGTVRAWGVAGEVRPCLALKRSLPAAAVLQVRDDLLSPMRQMLDGQRPLVTFGVLSEALRWVLAQASGSRERWWEAVGVDCADPDTAASLLLEDALEVNAGGVVLFSSIRPERVRRAAEVAARVATGCEGGPLAAFREMSAKQLALTS